MYRIDYYAIILVISIILLFILILPVRNIIVKYFQVKSDVESLEYNEGIIQLINGMIQSEIINKVKMSSMLGTKYQLSDFDQDVEDMVTNVYNGIKKENLIKDRMFYEPEHLFRYITNPTILIFYQYIMSDEE